MKSRRQTLVLPRLNPGFLCRTPLQRKWFCYPRTVLSTVSFLSLAYPRTTFLRPRLESSGIPSAIAHPFKRRCFPYVCSCLPKSHCPCPVPHVFCQFLGCKQSCLVFGGNELRVGLILHDPACRQYREGFTSFPLPQSPDLVLGQGSSFSHM